MAGPIKLSQHPLDRALHFSYYHFKFAGDFQLYSNHSRILHRFLDLGFAALPDILWHKQTNAPNKFMGSGMLPVGAYVTYEHEYILILRKGRRRDFTSEQEKTRRRESAFLGEERNLWFSDVWLDIKGAAQALVEYQDEPQPDFVRDWSLDELANYAEPVQVNSQGPAL